MMHQQQVQGHLLHSSLGIHPALWVPSTPHSGPHQASHGPREVRTANGILGPSSLPETPSSESGSINSDDSFLFMRRDDGSHTQISAHDGFLKLDQFARQQFIMGLNNREVEEPVQRAFPAMSANDAIFRNTVQKVRNLYKTWKNRTLSEADSVFRDIAFVVGDELSVLRDFKALGARLSEHFKEWWLSRVFPWAEEAVRWDECSPDGMRWVKCELPTNFPLLSSNLWHARCLYTTHHTG